MSGWTELELVEKPAIELFAELGYETLNGYAERFGGSRSNYGRETPGDVVLRSRLEAAVARLNPNVAAEALTQAVEALVEDRSALSPVQANREVYQRIKEGVKVAYLDEEGHPVDETVRIIDWSDPHQNDFVLISQFSVSGAIHPRRADLVGFVNGLPLVFVELKKSHGRLEHAYHHNLKDYRQTIPQLFWFNALVILSNGGQGKVGSMTAGWEHFADWKRIDDESEPGIVALETLIRGTCEPGRLLDLVENFTVFDESKGALVKVVARNHQYLGVNNTIASLRRIDENGGRLGVFWHTQGSGKSLSMVFFAQKVLRKLPGNWTFLIVTDRTDLDDQIFKNFASTGSIPREVQANCGTHLRRLLSENHRFLFTLIQKFGIPKGEVYPQLSDRSDIIVMTDEAHRSQYETLALNMRNALPNAAFLGFTGTPLMAGEERTKNVFGDYVSVYNFRQSIEDGATVPLYYENRIPELQIANHHFKEDLDALIDEAGLDEAQTDRLEREFARQYHLITRDERLERIAEDLVSHFMGRGQAGKAMMIAIDKQTAVRMYDKVQAYWKRDLTNLKAEAARSEGIQRAALDAKIRFMATTEMAVVISPGADEAEFFRAKGLDIETHRKRMETDDLELFFKNPNHPLRIVFVCAMWLTGFDAPTVSTIYLDKPMHNHTLMQTIARANRVFGDKQNGLIVDYIGVFENLQQALAIYGGSSAGTQESGDCPIQEKARLIEALRQAITEVRRFCDSRGVNVEAIIGAHGFEKVALIEGGVGRLLDKQVVEAVDDAVEQVLVNDDLKKQFLSLAGQVIKLYKAILPDPLANEFLPFKTCLEILIEKIKTFAEEVSIEDVMDKIEDLLDESVATKGYIIHSTEQVSLIDLGRIDLDALRAQFEAGRKRTEAERLKIAAGQKLDRMVELNKSRVDLVVKFQQMIDDYNQGLDVNGFFDKLISFVQELNREEQRGLAERLAEEELALFDILTKPHLDLSRDELNQVKAVSRRLLQTLKEAKLVLDWRKKRQTQSAVYITVKTILDELPRAFSTDLYQQKCDLVFKHVFDSYAGEGVSLYNPSPEGSSTGSAKNSGSISNLRA